jgi:hypothetical protein
MAADNGQQKALSANTSVQAASAPKAISDEEKRQRFAAMRERMKKSRLEVTPPPGKAAYWGPRDDDNELSRLSYLGFEIVKDDPKAPKWKAGGMREDGTYVMGDLILMSIDALEYDFLLQDNVDRANAQLSNVQDDVIGRAEEAGVPTFAVSKKNN